MRLSLFCLGALAATILSEQACRQTACENEIYPCDAASADDANRDAPGDANVGVVLPPAGWIRPDWVPEQCQVFQPVSADAWASIPPIDWVPCVAGLAVSACEQIALDWTANTAIAQVGAMLRTTAGDDELAIERSFDDHNEIQITQASTNSVETLWSEPYSDPCVLGAFENVTGAAGISLVTRTAQNSNIPIDYLLLVDNNASKLRDRVSPDYQFLSNVVGDGWVEASPATDSLVGLFVGATMSEYVLDRATTTVSTLGNALTTKPQAIGNNLFWGGVQSDRVVMMTWTHTDGATVFYDPGAGVAVHDIASDGTWISWVESSNPDGKGGFLNSALYVSPYVTDPKLLTKTKLRDNVCYASLCGAYLSNGFLVQGVASSPTDDGILIVRLSDRAQWYLPPPPSPHVLRIGWAGTSYFYMPFDKTLIRFPLTGLGAPNTD